MFGFGGSTQESRTTGRSQATSSSFGRSDSAQEALSGSLSAGSSVSGNQATSQSRIAFEDVFARLFGGSERAAASLDPSLLTVASNQLFGAGTDFLSSIGGDAGTGFLEERLATGDQLAEEQIGQLQSDLGTLFREELNPAIEDEAILGGQLGGGRQGVAQAGAIGEIADAFARGSVDIRTANQAQLDSLAAGVAERGIAGAQTGLAALPSLYGIADAGFGADLRANQLLAGILGGPQVLTESQATGFSTAQDFARAFSESFGRSSARSGSRSQSTSQTDSRSKGRSARIGFGGGG